MLYVYVYVCTYIFVCTYMYLSYIRIPSVRMICTCVVCIVSCFVYNPFKDVVCTVQQFCMCVCMYYCICTLHLCCLDWNCLADHEHVEVPFPLLDGERILYIGLLCDQDKAPTLVLSNFRFFVAFTEGFYNVSIHQYC